MQHCFQEPDHRSNQEGKRRRPGQHDAVQTHEGKAQPSEKEESMPPAATKKGLARTPGSQAGQPEEDQYHMVSLPGGSSKFSHIDSLRKETPTHTENPVGFLTDKPQRGFHQESGSSQTHRHTDIKTGLHKDLQIRTGNPTHPPVQPRQTGKMPQKTTYTSLCT